MINTNVLEIEKTHRNAFMNSYDFWIKIVENSHCEGTEWALAPPKFCKTMIRAILRDEFWAVVGDGGDKNRKK